jgi:hypothetical protein
VPSLFFAVLCSKLLGIDIPISATKWGEPGVAGQSVA